MKYFHQFVFVYSRTEYKLLRSSMICTFRQSLLGWPRKEDVMGGICCTH